MINSRCALLCMVMTFQSPAFAQSLDGIWKHPEESVWVEIHLADGVGKVVRNDAAPDRVGFELLRALSQNARNPRRWTGQVYVRKLGEYKEGEISLTDSGVMRLKVKVGFISRTVDWTRSDRGELSSPE